MKDTIIGCIIAFVVIKTAEKAIEIVKENVEEFKIYREEKKIERNEAK